MVGLRLAPPRRQCDVDYQPTGLPAPFDRAAEIVLDAALHEQRAETGAVGRHDRAIAAAFGPGQAEPAIAAALGLLRPVHLDPAVRTGERAMLRGIGREFEIGRASCRERVCQYVWISGVAVSLKKKK